MKSMGKVESGFTLIELLVVIAIILLLAGMLLPAFQYAREVGRKTKAKAEVKQLEVAFKAVQSDYRGWSTMGASPSGRDVDSGIVQFLRGSGNSRGVVYMEFDATSTNAAGAFIDPWNNAYQVALASAGFITPYGGAPVYREIGAWSRGKDGSDSTAATQKDNVTSW